MTSTALNTAQAEGCVALAFGCVIPAGLGRYFDIDVLAMRLLRELVPHIGREQATAIVLSHFDVWGDSAGRSEFDDREIYFTIGVIDKKRPSQREFLITGGTQEEVTGDFAGFAPTRVFSFNVKSLIRDIRERGQAAGIDLSSAFFLPPDHADYPKLLEQAKTRREQALTRMKRDTRLHTKTKRIPRPSEARDIRQPR
jgi:hypothetical protein